MTGLLCGRLLRGQGGGALPRDLDNFNMMAKTEAVKKRYLTTSGLTLGYLTDDEVKNVVSGTSRVHIAIAGGSSAARAAALSPATLITTTSSIRS